MGNTGNTKGNTMNTETRREYARFRKAGYDAQAALRNAIILQAWRVAEQAGLVRLVAEESPEDYFSVHGEPDGYEGMNGKRVSAEQEREEIVRQLDLYGLWTVVSENFVDGEWVMADCIGMGAGYKDPLSPLENWYVPDLMRGALDKVAQCGEH